MYFFITKTRVKPILGKASGKLRDQDVLDELLSCRAHDTLLLLSAAGRAYAIKAHKVPEASRAAMGTPIAQVGGRCVPLWYGGVLQPVCLLTGGDARSQASMRGGKSGKSLSVSLPQPTLLTAL